MSWMNSAKCEGMDPEKFTPMESETHKERTAKRVCKGCPVKMECLNYALETDSIGIFAGTNYSERQKMVSMMPSLAPTKHVESSRIYRPPESDEPSSLFAQDTLRTPRFQQPLLDF